MRRSCLLGLTLFLLLGLLAACGEAPDKENPRLPASEACLTAGWQRWRGRSFWWPAWRRGRGKVMSMRSPWASARGLQDPDQGAIRPGDGFRWGMAALWRRPSPPGWGR